MEEIKDTPVAFQNTIAITFSVEGDNLNFSSRCVLTTLLCSGPIPILVHVWSGIYLLHILFGRPTHHCAFYEPECDKYAAWMSDAVMHLFNNTMPCTLVTFPFMRTKRGPPWLLTYTVCLLLLSNTLPSIWSNMTSSYSSVRIRSW